MHHFKHSLRPRIIQRRIAVVAPKVPQLTHFRPALNRDGAEHNADQRRRAPLTAARRHPKLGRYGLVDLPAFLDAFHFCGRAAAPRAREEEWPIDRTQRQA